MIKIHKGTDVLQEIVFATVKISEIKDLVVQLVDPEGAIISTLLYDKVNDKTIKVKLTKDETDEFVYGVYSFLIKIGYSNSEFPPLNIEHRSDAYEAFEVVKYNESTGGGDVVAVSSICE